MNTQHNDIQLKDGINLITISISTLRITTISKKILSTVTLNIMTLSIRTFSKKATLMTLSITSLSITTLRLTKLSIMTFSTTTLDTEFCCDEWRILLLWWSGNSSKRQLIEATTLRSDNSPNALRRSFSPNDIYVAQLTEGMASHRTPLRGGNSSNLL